jgi:hypothetical protein
MNTQSKFLRVEPMKPSMQTRSKPFSIALLVLLSCSAAHAVAVSEKTSSVDEPEIVIGSSSRAMAMSAKKQVALPSEISHSIGKWSVLTKDVNLANTFQRWAGLAGWNVRWDAAKHVLVEAPDTFTGTFEEAVAAQLSSPGIAMSSYPLEVCFYPNTPPLARISRKGDQNEECK